MNEEKGLSNITVGLMVIVALICDMIQIVIQIAPVVGQIIAAIINVFTFLIFLIWFGVHGVRFAKPKRLLTFGGGTLVEFMSLGILPTWTIAVLIVSLDARVGKVVQRLDIIKR